MELLEPKEASEYLKVSIHTLAAWRSQGEGPRYIKTGRHIKYDKKDLDRYLKKQTINPEK